MRISPKQFLSGLLYAAPILLLALASCGGGGGGTTSATTPVVAPSTAPTGITASTGCSAINLKWSPVAGATGYYVYHAASGLTATKTLATTNSYTDTGLQATTTYNYQVAAANTAGEGPKSNPAVSKTTGAACTNVGGSVQSGTPLALSITTSTVSTMAGAALFPGYVNSTTGINARFDLPANVATDGKNLYVADSANNAIRKINISTDEVSTFAGSLTGASGVQNGTGTAATFNGPQGITTDGTYLYVADTKSGTIRKILVSSGAVTTMTTIPFNRPAAITTDGTYLYVADTFNNQIVQLNSSGATNAIVTVSSSPQGITYNMGDSDLYVTGASGISQIADMGAVGMGAPSVLNVGGIAGYAPQGITTDGTDLYVTLSSIGTVIRVAALGGTPVTDTIAGTGYAGYKDGTASAAQFRQPYGITTDGANLYIVDTGNSTIRKIQ